MTLFGIIYPKYVFPFLIFLILMRTNTFLKCGMRKTLIIIKQSPWAKFYFKCIFLFLELTRRSDSRHVHEIYEALIYRNMADITSLHIVLPLLNSNDIYFSKPSYEVCVPVAGTNLVQSDGLNTILKHDSSHSTKKSYNASLVRLFSVYVF